MALNNLSSFKEKFDDLLSLGRLADKKTQPGGLLPKIAQELLGQGSGEFAAEVVPILRDMLVQGKLKLPDDAVAAKDFKPEQAEHIKSVLSEILKAAGQPGLAMASSAAIDIFKKSVDSCGFNRNATKVDGLPVKKKGDRDVILYFVQEGSDGEALLPLVDGSRKVARKRLKAGFLNWAVKMKLDVSPVGRQEEANLLVTGEHLGNTTTLATTEIGPPNGRQLRMAFNLSKDFDGDTFEACAAHEFGHALGIFHEDVNMSDKSLCMYPTNLGVTMPQAGDLKAAKDKGWIA